MRNELMVNSLYSSEGSWSEETRVMHWKQNGRYPVSSVVSTVIKDTTTQVQFSTDQIFSSSFLEQTFENRKFDGFVSNGNGNGDILSFFEVN